MCENNRDEMAVSATEGCSKDSVCCMLALGMHAGILRFREPRGVTAADGDPNFRYIGERDLQRVG